MAVIGKRLYVLYHNNNSIQVYDTTKFELRRELPVANIGAHTGNGLTSCAKNCCLYINDRDGHQVHRLEVYPEFDTMKSLSPFSVGRTLVGMSVTPSCNLLITCEIYEKLDEGPEEDSRPEWQDYRLEEYTTKGIRIRVITLELFDPLHAILLHNGHFVVSANGSIVEIEVDEERGGTESVEGSNLRREGIENVKYFTSRVVKRFNDCNFPRHLAAVDCNRIVVADRVGNEIFVLNRLQWSKWSVAEMTKPRCLCLDVCETGSKLYVGLFRNSIECLSLERESIESNDHCSECS